MKKHCPKCKSSFECLSNDIAKCQCSTLHVSETTLKILENQEWDCLCKECLVKYKKLSEESKTVRFPAKKKDLIEGKHFYFEGGYLVFTELYHYQKGKCCGNNCRHCVFGFKDKV